MIASASAPQPCGLRPEPTRSSNGEGEDDRQHKLAPDPQGGPSKCGYNVVMNTGKIITDSTFIGIKLIVKFNRPIGLYVASK